MNGIRPQHARIWLAAALLGAPSAGGAQDTTARVPEARIYAVFEVDTPATERSNSAHPVYPRALKAAGVQGEVVAQFVVDTSGYVDIRSFKVLRATQLEFSEAVIAALPGMRFEPAVRAGTHVMQSVTHPFLFSIPGLAASGAPVLTPDQAEVARGGWRAIAGDTPPPSFVRGLQSLSPNYPGLTPSRTASAGKVPGWTLTTHTMLDSGNGHPHREVTLRMSGAGERIRIELTPVSGLPSTLLYDAAARTITELVAASRSAFVTSLSTPAGMPPNPAPAATATVSARPARIAIVNQVYDDPIAGLATTRARLDLYAHYSGSFGETSCSNEVLNRIMTWRVMEPGIRVVERALASLPEPLVPELDPVTEALFKPFRDARADSGSIAKLLVYAGGQGSRPPVILTHEVVAFAESDIDPATLAVPTGFTTVARTRPPAPTQSASAVERAFWTRFDTTAAAGPERATCLYTRPTTPRFR